MKSSDNNSSCSSTSGEKVKSRVNILKRNGSFTSSSNTPPPHQFSTPQSSKVGFSMLLTSTLIAAVFCVSDSETPILPRHLYSDIHPVLGESEYWLTTCLGGVLRCARREASICLTTIGQSAIVEFLIVSERLVHSYRNSLLPSIFDNTPELTRSFLIQQFSAINNTSMVTLSEGGGRRKQRFNKNKRSSDITLQSRIKSPKTKKWCIGHLAASLPVSIVFLFFSILFSLRFYLPRTFGY